MSKTQTYKLTEEGLNYLNEALHNMIAIRVSLAAFLLETSDKKSYQILYQKSENDSVMIGTFNKRLRIDLKHYLVLNQNNTLFESLEDYLIKIEK